MKNTTTQITESLVIIGDNFISETLYNDYKRFGKVKVLLISDINSITNTPNYIIDCTLNKYKQEDTFKYCGDNNVHKLLLINHWEIKNIPKIDTIILQSIIYDVYGNNHVSFNRQDCGNTFDDGITYCTLISESIRRINDSKNNFIPITYIPYGEDKIKYVNVNNLFEPLNYMIMNIKNNCVFSIYDEEKSIGYILGVIKEVFNYTGDIIILNYEPMYTKYIKSLDYNFKKNYFDFEIKKIHKYLTTNNTRFMAQKNLT